MRWLVAAVAVVAAASCRKVTQPPMVGEELLADSADQVALDVRMHMTHSGVKRGELFADTMYVFEAQTKFLLRRVRANFHTELGAPNGNLRGDRGTYDLRTKTLEGYGNVVVTSTKGERLTSEHLKYVESANQVSSDSAYRLVQTDRVQTGIGFTSDPNLIRFRCKSACGGSAPDVIRTLPRP